MKYRPVGPPPAMSMEESLIARDEHRQSGRGAAWVRERDMKREDTIEQWKVSSVMQRRDSPLS